MLYRFMIAFAFVALLGFVSARAADDAKSVTLNGTLTCAKCDLKETTECQNVLVVKDGDQTTKYYLADNALSKESHGAVCKAPKHHVSVTGTVQDKDGKHWITATKIEGLSETKSL